MTNNESGIRDAIMKTLDENDGEFHGTEKLAAEIHANKRWLIQGARKIERLGLLLIIRSLGGRGRQTVYRSNRNSPGQPRKRA